MAYVPSGHFHIYLLPNYCKLGMRNFRKLSRRCYIGITVGPRRKREIGAFLIFHSQSHPKNKLWKLPYIELLAQN